MCRWTSGGTPATGMRVLFVIDSLGRAGTEHSLLHLLRELHPAHLHGEVAALGAPYDLAPDFAAAGICVHRLGGDGSGSPAAVVRRLARIVRDGRFDAVRAHLFWSAMAVGMAPLLGSATRIVSFHGLDYEAYPARGWRGRARKAAHAAALYRMHGHVAISRAVAVHYRDHMRLDDIRVIPNGFPLPPRDQRSKVDRAAVLARYGIDPATFVLVLPGRFVPEKGHDLLLDALRELASRDKHPSLMLFGVGPLRERVRARVERDGLDRVRILDAVPQSELVQAVAASDALVIPSPRGEGFGRAPAEAMALGVPVVASAVGGFLDFIDDGRDGLLVRPGDGRDLAGAVQRLMDDPPLRRRLGDAGRSRIEGSFAIERVADQWMAYLREVVERRRHTTA